VSRPRGRIATEHVIAARIGEHVAILAARDEYARQELDVELRQRVDRDVAVAGERGAVREKYADCEYDATMLLRGSVATYSSQPS